ncbi:hypothetical protein HOLleu_40873 [Holothuria leucospilota]|uniref:Uncharacterized protein n=1 Tax=Holothuria leucospilota TaxID=206669 RepID=A0A9Q0YEU1_HOLLE|nr:hypothetical protein HOLleu_40873 [Holothuria leucospilota]
MGTGASELKQKMPEESEPVRKVTSKSYPNEIKTAGSRRRDEIRRRSKPQEDTKDIANIFKLPPLPATDEVPFSQDKFDPNLSSGSDDSLLVRVSVSPGELQKRKDDVSLSNLSLDDGPSSKELDSLTSEIDMALEGHDDVMKDIRGVYFIHSVTSRCSADLSNSNVNTVLRPKGSMIEPLPEMIPVRVNWSDSEKLTETREASIPKVGVFESYRRKRKASPGRNSFSRNGRENESDERDKSPRGGTITRRGAI